MKILATWLAASMVAACASNPAPPAQASDSAATSQDDAPKTAQDSSATAPSTADGPGSSLVATDAAQGMGRGATSPSLPSSAPSPASPAPDNAVATTGGSEPDNSRVNSRDKNGATLTPMDQGPSEGDRKITQQVRQAIVKDGSLSFTAKNVKIITINGKVTLRGPVKNDRERSTIEAAAKQVAGANQVDNLLEVKN